MTGYLDCFRVIGLEFGSERRENQTQADGDGIYAYPVVRRMVCLVGRRSHRGGRQAFHILPDAFNNLQSDRAILLVCPFSSHVLFFQLIGCQWPVAHL